MSTQARSSSFSSGSLVDCCSVQSTVPCFAMLVTMPLIFQSHPLFHVPHSALLQTHLLSPNEILYQKTQFFQQSLRLVLFSFSQSLAPPTAMCFRFHDGASFCSLPHRSCPHFILQDTTNFLPSLVDFLLPSFCHQIISSKSWQTSFKQNSFLQRFCTFQVAFYFSPATRSVAI